MSTINKIELSVRARKAVNRLGLLTWQQVEAVDFDTLLSLRNAGPMTIRELLVALTKKINGDGDGDANAAQLRDEFAMRAMSVIGKRMDSIERNWTPGMLAKTAYEIADAMLQAREANEKASEVAHDN